MPSSFSYIFLWIFCWISNGEKSCAHFKFEKPDIEKDILTARAHSTVEIVFHLDTLECQNIAYSIINIERFVNNSYASLCRILHKGNSCTSSVSMNGTCACINNTYHFSKTLDRLDNTQWRWKWVNSEEKESIKLITFNILYLPQVINLTMNGHAGVDPLLVHKGESISILCSWKNGNPHVNGHLLKFHKNALISNSKNENLSMLIKEVNCSDAGVYSCEADNSERNLSATLLVKCPPVFTQATSQFKNITSGRRMALTFSFSTYTTYIKRCTLYPKHNFGNDKASSLDCSTVQTEDIDHTFDGEPCWCNVEGVPPNLTLTVVLFKSSKEFDGKWRLFIENLIGGGETNVFLHIINTDDTYLPTVASISKNENLVPTIIGVGIAIGLGVITSICVVLFILLNKWKKLQLSLPNGSETSGNNGGRTVAVAPSQETPSVNVCDYSKIKLMEDNAMSATLNSNHELIQTASGLEPNVRWLYEKADSMQVVFHIKGRQSVLENQQYPRIVLSENVSQAMPSAPGHSTLERVNKCASNDTSQEGNVTREEYLTPCPPTYCQPSEFSKYTRADVSQYSFLETGANQKCIKDNDTVSDLKVSDVNNYYYSTID